MDLSRLTGKISSLRERARVRVENLRQRRSVAAQLKAQKQAARKQAAIIAAAPQSPYRQEWVPLLKTILPRVSREHRAIVVEALEDLEKYNLLQPKHGRSNRQGVEARRRQWNKIAGGRAGKPDYRWMFGGVSLGVLAGAIIGMGLAAEGMVYVPPPEPAPVVEGAMPTPTPTPDTEERGSLPALPFPVPMMIVMAVFLAPVGGIIGHMLGTMGGYYIGMMRVIVNERRSVIRPEMVTGQVEAWIPKALLSWRSHEWRYQGGKPYLWLHLPLGRRIQDELRGTQDYLLLQNDLYRARDAAVYAQRSMNRMVADNALDFADVDAGEKAGVDRLKEMMPFLVPVGIALLGVIIVMMVL